jgi:hypothetical protein
MVPIFDNPKGIYTGRLAKSLIFFLLPLQLVFAFTPVYIDMLQADRTDFLRYLGGNLWIGALFYGLMAAAMQRLIIFIIFYHKRGWKKHKSSIDDGYGELINKSLGITVGVSFLLIGIAFLLLAFTTIYALYFGIAFIIGGILALYKGLSYGKKDFNSERPSNYYD